eukprot:TRINITY_DN15806_c0_g1_i1.p1 TRINITY_DN15806_c0_g1~~TRINITY_DN15806_c0_g1_i1.p1  ORF type:complete len:523 (-),score=110.88 TRINITY_DN15806_c0_g1_i1:196-1764(-)
MAATALMGAQGIELAQAVVRTNMEASGLRCDGDGGDEAMTSTIDTMHVLSYRTAAPSAATSSSTASSSSARPSLQPITVTIKTLTGREVRLEVDAMESLQQVKQRFQDREGVPPDQIRLISTSGKCLEDGRTLAHYGIADGSILHLITNLRGGCFVAGTRVGLDDGRSVPIEEVEAGMMVQSCRLDKNAMPDVSFGDASSNALAAGKVNRTFKRLVHADAVATVYLRPPTPPLDAQDESAAIVELQCTDTHPLYVAEKGWCAVKPDASMKRHAGMDVGALAVGDRVVMMQRPGEMGEAEVTKIAKMCPHGDGCNGSSVTVYNLHVDGTACYFAGGALVHNTSGEVYDRFKLTASVFDPRFDYDFTKVRDGAKRFSRGGRAYKRPEGAVRKALKVTGRFPGGDAWLAADDKASTWPVAFHGTSATAVAPIANDGLRVGGSSVPRRNGAAYGSGVYVSPMPEYALRYAPRVRVSGTNYRVVFQCRVRPGSFTEHENDCGAYGQRIWVVSDPKSVRPYGICFYAE